MTPIAKIALTVASVGAVGSGVGLGIHFLNSENPNALKLKLASEGFNTEVSETEWDTILSAHNTSENTNLFKSADVEKKDKDWIKNKCYEALNKEDEDNLNYKLAIQWCVKPETITSILGKDISKFRLLNTVATATATGTDKDAWTGIISLLEKDSNAKGKLSVNLSDSNIDTKIKEIKSKCETVNGLKTTSVGFQEKFELAKKWCAVEKQV